MAQWTITTASDTCFDDTDVEYNIQNADSPVRRLYAVSPRENSRNSHMLRNLSSLATFLSLTVRASVYSVTCGGLRKQQCAKIRRNIRKWNQTLTVI